MGLSFLSSSETYAWSPPTQVPTNANSLGPLSVSSVTQSKIAGLIFNSAGATYGLLVPYGKVGIGTLIPSNLFEVANPTSSTVSVSPCQIYCNTNIASRWATTEEMTGGYSFTPSYDGFITKLWMMVSTSNTSRIFYLRLYDESTANVLASANVTSSQAYTWISTNITPVFVSVGKKYIVAVGGSGLMGTSPALCCSFGFPKYDVNFVMNYTVFSYGRNTFPGPSSSQAWGLADVTFSPAQAPFFGVKSDGHVGIGKQNPLPLLSVAGGIQPSDDSASCVTAKAGTLRWHSNVMEICNGSAWIAI